jgi:maltose O-acetyltransferase
MRWLKFSLANAVQASSIVSVSVRMRLLRLYGLKCESGSRVFQHTFFGLAMSVQLLTSTHEIGPAACRAGTTLTAPVKIGNGCWLGAGTIVQPGVVIADGCIVASGSVVTKSTEPNDLYASVPAKRIRDLN